LRYFGLARQRQYLLSRKLSIIFMLRCDRIPVMLNLLTAVVDSHQAPRRSNTLLRSYLKDNPKIGRPA
jgi:hypothetical protein